MFSGIAWSALERIAVQAVQFILGIILARLLTPKEYGILGILLVFISISQVFIDSGFTKALIQKKERSNQDTSTVFWFNIFISLFCYLALWISAPYISNFYEIPILSILLRVLALSLIINAIYAVPSTLLTIDLDFKKIAKINLASVTISGIIAVALAYYDYGVWALVWQTLIRSLLLALFIWFSTTWKPLKIFSKSSFKNLFTFGSNLLVSSLIASFFSNLNAILIGKYVGAKDLGFYTRGIQFSDFIFTIFNSTLNNVLLPGLSPIQDNKELLISNVKIIIKSAAIIIIPIFIGLSAMAEPLIRVLLTDKWLMAVPILQLFCYARMITILSSINVNLLYVLGRTDLALKQEYIKTAIRVILLILALQFGIIYIAFAELISTVIHFFINTYYPGKIMEFGAFKQLKSIWKIAAASILMIIPIYTLNYFIPNDIVKLIVSPLVGIIIYFFSVRLLKIKEFTEIIKKLRSLTKSKK